MEFELMRIPDPLNDKFRLDELPSIAPWVYDEITSVGVDQVKNAIAETGEDPDGAQPMTCWVTALQSRHSRLWEALEQG